MVFWFSNQVKRDATPGFSMVTPGLLKSQESPFDAKNMRSLFFLTASFVYRLRVGRPKLTPILTPIKLKSNKKISNVNKWTNEEVPN